MVAKELNVNRYAVHRTRDLLKEKGILALPELRKGKFDQETIG